MFALKASSAAPDDMNVISTVLSLSSEGVVVTDADGNILWVNDGFTKISGFSGEETKGRKISILKSGHHSRGFYTAMWRSLAEKGEWAGEIWNKRKDGELYPQWLNIRALRSDHRHPDRYVGVFSDLSALKHAEKKINELTYFDAVTGLPKLLLLHDRICQDLATTKRNGRQVAVVLVSLDRFATINETLGHEQGDCLLSEVAGRLKSCVGSRDMVSRVRGDLFACIATDLSNHESIGRIVRNIIDAFGLPFLGEQELYMTASVGISLFPDDAEEWGTLLQTAEGAVTRAKRHSGSTYEFYTIDKDGSPKERLRLESELRRALNGGDQLELYYQPKVDGVSGFLVGAEALIRWRHPRLGLLLPGEFIQIAEDTGLIIPMGEWALNAACNQLRIWSAEGHAIVPVAVNVSTHQFHQPNLDRQLERVICESGIDPAFVELELTERAVMSDAEAGGRVLRRMRDMGVTVAIDDFGTGYSSLGYLTKFAVDRLKIDRSFVTDLPTSPASAQIVQAIITLAHTLNMSVTAEGVETAAQLAALRDMKCDEIQGFYYSQPIPASEFARYFEQPSGRPNSPR